MRILIIKPVIILSLFLLAPGCATYWQMKTVDENVSGLQNQMQEMRQKNTQLQQEIYALKNSTGKIDESSQRAKVDLVTRIESLEQQMQALNYKMDEMNDRLSAFFQKFERPSFMNSASDSLNGLSSSQSSPGLDPGDDINAAELYKNANLDLSKGHYELAIRGFAEYTRRFPGSELADNAQFNIGEAYYGQGNYREALNEFRKVMENYHQSDRTAAALLKMGLCYQALGDSKNGRSFLERVVQQYPSSSEASIAQSRLKRAKN